MRVDGNDVLAVMAAARIAIDRPHGGPTFDPSPIGWAYTSGRSTTTACGRGRAQDPIARLKSLLERKGLLTEDLETAVAAKADAVAKALRAGTINMPEPAPMDIFKHVYSTPNSSLDRQQDHYSRYLASFGDPAEAASEEGAR
jgi:pyruvate dehydrogenase E1 component alpha subunit